MSIGLRSASFFIGFSPSISASHAALSRYICDSTLFASSSESTAPSRPRWPHYCTQALPQPTSYTCNENPPPLQRPPDSFCRALRGSWQHAKELHSATVGLVAHLLSHRDRACPRFFPALSDRPRSPLSRRAEVDDGWRSFSSSHCELAALAAAEI